jgi:CDP-diacylglycerol pyrophosphatase
MAGAPDLILAPTRRITGVEDPALQALDRWLQLEGHSTAWSFGGAWSLRKIATV